MLKTFELRGRTEPIVVYGPVGLTELFGALRRIFGKLTYPYRIVELAPGAVLERDGYRVVTFAASHRVAALGYALLEDDRPGRFDVARADSLGVPAGPARGALQRGEEVVVADGRVVRPDEVLGEARRGRKIVLTGDTGPSPLVIEAAVGADVLVHEATFCEDDRERAKETGHSTASEAAEVARRAGVRLLALTHISPRYLGHDVADEARRIFPESVVPKDFDVVDVPFPERGPPALVKRGARADRRAAGVEDTAHPEPEPLGASAADAV
jgi:ribonuclease Z